ncbi:SH2 [Nesidiocoris tenuis]|uniref:SH2 n=1 Tax=Nesidiocoris tenuis TaxID=355587 RepID=A0ABN7AVA3_9HEMI|nr:SH2 [Nesidiocoris tenuis]
MSPRAEGMSRRHRYETAFDSKISKSDDDLDVDEVTHKSILVINHREDSGSSSMYYRRPRSLEGIEEKLTRGMLDIDIGIKPYLNTSPPPSTSLPTKYHSSFCVASSSRSPDVRIRSKDLKLPIKSSKPRAKSCFLGKFDCLSHLPDSTSQGRRSKKTRGKEVLEIKSRPRRGTKYSSSESMATSSSGGSLESLKSSTSEGNRSTSSCESRHSSSLSSHSSETAPPAAPVFLSNMPSSLSARVFQLNKLNVLSPISDKSSQEPCSEASENNKNNNSEKASPDEAVTPGSETQKKRRTPQNRNVFRGSLNVELETHNGSDSGISVLSRVGPPEQLEFNDLPFDMPKLRRRKILQMESCSVQDTSGSATSVDLRDLPFDMPKLRRRQRAQISISNVSQGSSTSSIMEDKTRMLRRPCLSLDLQDFRLRPTSIDFQSQDLTLNLPQHIDSSCPLEEQKWFHGCISRNEAEAILRGQKEGSYLVRNSERTKQDYSLSCKCIRGFLHMRIQQAPDTGQYVLGNFTKTFRTIPELVKFYSTHRLPIGAEPLCLLYPVAVQLL